MTPTARPEAAERPLILVAEDETTTRQALVRYLGIKGFSVIEAANGQEAVKLFELHTASVRLCLIDLNMPLMDGPACIAAIRQRAPKLPIFLLTGEIDGDHMPEELTSAVQRSFLKPFDWNELIDAINEAL